MSLELDTGWLSNLIGKEIEAYGTAETGSPEEKLVFKAKRIVILGKL
jgi:hypothetical protein